MRLYFRGKWRPVDHKRNRTLILQIIRRPFFYVGLVNNRGFSGDFGLLSIGPAAQNLNLPATQVVAVSSLTPAAPSFAQQLIVITGATAGTQFTLSYGGNTSAAFPWTTDNTALVKSIVNALTGLGGLQAANILVGPVSLFNGLGTIQVTFTGGPAPRQSPLP